jgi:hypothetical protein
MPRHFPSNGDSPHSRLGASSLNYTLAFQRD